MKTNQTLKEILLQVWDCGYTIDTPDTQGMSVDQALKEISELLLECLPEKRNSSWFEQEFGIDSPVVTGYNLAVEDCEHHIKARLQ